MNIWNRSDLKINELAELLHVHRNSVSALINNNRKTHH